LVVDVGSCVTCWLLCLFLDNIGAGGDDDDDDDNDGNFGDVDQDFFGKDGHRLKSKPLYSSQKRNFVGSRH
jgi:hypothetical protein